jgi:hypothetical protein
MTQVAFIPSKRMVYVNLSRLGKLMKTGRRTRKAALGHLPYEWLCCVCDKGFSPQYPAVRVTVRFVDALGTERRDRSAVCPRCAAQISAAYRRGTEG